MVVTRMVFKSRLRGRGGVMGAAAVNALSGGAQIK